MSNSNPEFKPGDRVVVLAEPRYLVDQLVDPSPGLEDLAGTVLDCEVYPTSPAHAPDYRIEFDDDPDGGLSKCAIDEPYLALRKTNEHHHQGLTACRIKAEPGLAEAG